MASYWSEDEDEGEPGPFQFLQTESAFQLERSKHPRVAILKDILKSIKLDDGLIKENNVILGEFLTSFINKLKEVDELFKLLFKELRYTGSFYSKLRISTPDEFDINLVLRLPKDLKSEVQHQPQAPSYVKYRLKNHSTALENYPKLAKTLFKNGYLIPEKVRNWLQSIVDKAEKSMTQKSNIKVVTIKQAGPARNVILMKTDGTSINIDLVPVMECQLDLPRSSFDGRVEKRVCLVDGTEKKENNLNAFLVPKSYSSFGRQMPINEEEASYLWRSHFPEAEKIIIFDLGCVKNIIKLLKLLRDKEDWKILASYYLKTVVMWMVVESNFKRDYWKEDKMDELFLEALQKLDNMVSQRKLTYMFNKRYNLLEKLNPQQAENIHHRLVHLTNKIKNYPNFLWNIFHATPLF